MTAAAIVLAAGAGTRFGATKQLARVGDRPLVAHTVEVALEAEVDEVVVVLGHDAASVAGAVPDEPRVRTVVAEEHAEGMGASLREGVAALGAEVEAAVVLLADQPGVSSAAVRAVLDAVEGHDAARARYDDGPGHPVAFARRTFGELRQLGGDEGARRLLPQLDVAEVRLAGPTPPDVDHPRDLDDVSS